MSVTDCSMHPRFLGQPGARFFTLQFAPRGVARAHIVFVPPFVEEMNRCRSLVAQQARAFAQAGYSCTLVDFIGTGDSEGELAGASLRAWHANLDLVVETLRSELDVPLILWGMRLGGLLALGYAAKSALPVQQIILWQPVNSAKLYITQVLRQRVATLMMKGLPAETTKEIRQRIEDGEAVEVAGYTLARQLVADIEAVEIEQLGKLAAESIHWLEHVAEPGKDIGVASAKAVEKLVSLGNSVAVRTFSDPQVWQLHEREYAPELLRITSGLLT